MIEIALCLAIVGFALVSIMLVLPSGMNTQSQTRQQTIIGQDASELIEAIRTGARGQDDLTNYVYAITNYWKDINPNGSIRASGPNGYTYTSAFVNGAANPYYSITNGARIIGLLSTPELQVVVGSGNVIQYTISNHVVAFVHSLSGLAAEKPPQNNQIMRENTFSYRVLCINAPEAQDTNALQSPQPSFAREVAGNLHELRLLYSWPLFPNGNVGDQVQNFRVSVAGQIIQTNDPLSTMPLNFYQPEFFTNTP